MLRSRPVGPAARRTAWRTLCASAGLLAASVALAQGAGKPAPQAAPAATATPAMSDHARKDVQRHRAMAAAHEAAARCLEAGKDESECQKALAADCKGLAIGKYCGMRHEH